MTAAHPPTTFPRGSNNFVPERQPIVVSLEMVEVEGLRLLRRLHKIRMLRKARALPMEVVVAAVVVVVTRINRSEHLHPLRRRKATPLRHRPG